MQRFHIVEDGAVIILASHVYRQAKLYVRDGKLYAGYGAGFVKLLKGGGTTHPKVRWFEIDPAGQGEVSEEVFAVQLISAATSRAAE